jgi:transcriptional regulator with XRE-family HTH domain
MEKIAANIKALRKANNMTQQQLADFVGMNRVQLAYLEKGARGYNFTIIQINKLSDLFMVDSYDLLYEDVFVSPMPLKDIPKDPETMKSVMSFFKVIKNYLRIVKLKATA